MDPVTSFICLLLSKKPKDDMDDAVEGFMGLFYSVSGGDVTLLDIPREYYIRIAFGDATMARLSLYGTPDEMHGQVTQFLKDHVY